MHSGELATAEKVPWAHSVQAEAPVPFTPVALPAGHARHLLSVALAGFQVPSLHLTQAVAPAPPLVTVISPGPHGVHAAAAACAEKEPAGQVLHAWAPSPAANSPASLQGGGGREGGVRGGYAGGT